MTPITLTPPPEFIQELAAAPAPRTWHFGGLARPALDGLFRAAGLADAEREALWQSCTTTDETQFACTPDDEFVRRLTPDARAMLYGRLGLDERNTDQESAFRYMGASVDAWLGEAGVEQAIVDAIKPLTYRNHGYWLFADARLVQPAVADPQVWMRLLRALSADQTWHLQLRVTADSDIDALTAYWGRGGREQQVRPMIESLGKVPGGAALDIGTLLPPFAQARLATYPVPTLDPVERERDCHWTAMNFFQATPDDRFFGKPDLLVEEIKTRYYPVFGNFQLGDVVLFMADDSLFHSAVHIADDMLFTKNGPNPSNPWMFVRRDDMVNYYPQADTIRVSYYRRNSLDE